VTIHLHSERAVVEFDGPYGPLHIERSCLRTLKHFKRPPDFAPPTFAPVEKKATMPVFDFPRITILPDTEGRKMVRTTVVNQRTRAIMTIWEYIDGARVLESNFERFRRTRFSAPLKRFLLADLAADVVAGLIENGGYEARLTERYRELLTDLEQRLASSFSTPALRTGGENANPADSRRLTVHAKPIDDRDRRMPTSRPSTTNR
jgi:hypothetical protein